MGKYDDLVFCRGRTSQARSVNAPKNSVIIFFHTKSITYKYCSETYTARKLT
jgi:hypothetical protein